MLRFLFHFVLLIFAFSAPAMSDELRIYGFTSTFVDCVKKHKTESSQHAADGAAQSALMNGSSVLNGPVLDGQYWQYMDCLTPSNSGLDNQALASAVSCPEISINLGDRALYVPPGVSGKKFTLGDRTWICESGSWVRDGVSSGEGNAGGDTDVRYEDCLSVNVQIDSCLFSLPSRPHGESFLATSTLAEPYDGIFYSGKGLFSCNNQKWTQTSQQPVTCEPVQCSEKQEVYWSSSDSVAQCSGVIGDDGVAPQQEQEPRYYGSYQDALTKTKVMMGIAEYACTQSGWKMKYSTCSQKPIQSLVCSSRTTSIGTKEFSCQ